MNILIAPDKFKGSLPALEVCQAIAQGILKNHPTANIRYHPLADGGDGTLSILQKHLHLNAVSVATEDSLGRPLTGEYLVGGDKAFIEVATAAGLVLLSSEERNPLHTSTHGTGLMIADALRRGLKTIYLLLGGSATHDLGTGIAYAMGYRFLDKDEKEIVPNGAGLELIQKIVPPKEKPWAGIETVLLCDVNNPLVGKRGSAHVYAAQKGADAETIDRLEKGSLQLGRLFDNFTGTDISNTPGGGAAGGISAGLLALFGATLHSGFQTISELTKLETAIDWADHVITGEGGLDDQSLDGKVVGGVIGLCVDRNKSYSIVVGKNALPKEYSWPGKQPGIHEIMSLTCYPEQAMREAAAYLNRLGAAIEL